jgi:hypothetical protein
MSKASSTPSWSLLPLELLEHIFRFIPVPLLESIGAVCCRWRDALHHLAVKHLTGCIQKGQIEEQQLDRWAVLRIRIRTSQRYPDPDPALDPDPDPSIIMQK